MKYREAYYEHNWTYWALPMKGLFSVSASDPSRSDQADTCVSRCIEAKTELETSQQPSLQASRASEIFPLTNTSLSAPVARMTSEAPTRRDVLFVPNEFDSNLSCTTPFNRHVSVESAKNLAHRPSSLEDLLKQTAAANMMPRRGMTRYCPRSPSYSKTASYNSP